MRWPKTLLQGVNEVLIKASALDTSGQLSSLSDNARQTWIDLAVQVLNEVVDEIYSLGKWSKPKQLKVGTITLATNAREYALRSDAIRLRTEFDLIDETNNHIIEVLGDDGYYQIIRGDHEQDDTGKPTFCAISPISGNIYMDRIPTATENGLEYKYRYDRDFELEDATDQFPFSNAVFRAVIPAAAELWKLNRHQDFSSDVFRLSLGRAGRLARKTPPRQTWMPKSAAPNATDPMHD